MTKSVTTLTNLMVPAGTVRLALGRYAPLWPYLRWIGAGVMLGFWVFAPTGGFDANSYHSIDYSDPYANAWHTPDSFVYSPAVAQVLYPFTLLPLEVFEKILLGANLLALGWLIGPVWGALSLAMLPVYSELFTGQIHLLLAVSLVVGAWPVILLTKVTPGVGILYHVTRGEWRSVGVALGVTGAIVAVSLLLWPSAWFEWIELLRESPDTPAHYLLIDWPLLPRLVAASVLAVIAGLKGWRWMLPVVVLLALPAVWFNALVLLAAIPRLLPSRP